MNRRLRVAGMVCVLGWGSTAAFGQTGDSPAAPTGVGLFNEPRAIVKAARFAERATREREYKDGFFVEFGHMITGSGWISAGPGYRHRIFGGRAVASASAAVSWRLYNMAHASVEVPATARSPLSFGVGALYQDALQVNFFGLGNDALEQSRSGYRLQSFDVDGHTAYVKGPWTVQARAGWMPTIAVRPMEGREPSYPNIGALFTDATAPGLTRQPAFAHADTSLTFDVRDVPGRPTSGGVYTASLASYRDLDTGAYSFQSVQLEGAHYVPLVGQRWIAALHAWTTLTSAGNGHVVPFYLMPNLGGKSTLRGFPDYRFYGPQMEVFSAESRVAIFDHVDIAVFIDAGRVADRVSQLGFSGLQRTPGAGVRFHTARNTVARLDVARGTDGWFLVFKLTEPFKRKTFSGNLSPTVPFVP